MSFERIIVCDGCKKVITKNHLKSNLSYTHKTVHACDRICAKTFDKFLDTKLKWVKE